MSAVEPGDPFVQRWHAMGLGPLWRLRAARPDEAAAGSGGGAGAGRSTLPEGQATAVEAPVAALDWDALEARVAGCTRCGLCASRTRTVFGVGLRQAGWMIVGEAPGAEEDLRGEPFVGQAGRLLDNMLASIGLSRTATDPQRAVYIANVLKCRPPGNRNPNPEEVACCEPYLGRQLALLRPRMVIVMGRFAAQAVLGTDASIASLRGAVHRCRLGGVETAAVVTYHPAYLLRNLVDKSKAWADLCLARTACAAAGAVGTVGEAAAGER